MPMRDATLQSNFKEETERGRLELHALVEELKEAHTGMGLFHIGNACTWCCTKWNPTPEVKISNLVDKISTVLEATLAPEYQTMAQLSKPGPTPRYGDAYEYLQQLHMIHVFNLESLLQKIKVISRKMATEREGAQKFLAEYSIL